MIIAQLKGGLGNQLFQYAAGRAVAHRCSMPLTLDLSRYEWDPKRCYRLDRFNIQARPATPSEVAHVTGENRRGLQGVLFRFGQKLKPYHRRTVVREKHFHFDPYSRRIRSATYLEGYWQSDKYFEDIAPILRQELTLKYPLEPINEALARRIGEVEAVSVHVRRGDYAADPKTKQTHGTCTPAYYGDAVEQMRRLLRAPHFFVFSDDISWAEANLSFEGPVTYVDHNGQDRDYEDLALMSFCRHHIIANSSFSWWGAWLSDYPDKHVMAPKRWMRDPQHCTKDVVPTTWHRV